VNKDSQYCELKVYTGMRLAVFCRPTFWWRHSVGTSSHGCSDSHIQISSSDLSTDFQTALCNNSNLEV